jgi:hypothetical protein
MWRPNKRVFLPSSLFTYCNHELGILLVEDRQRTCDDRPRALDQSPNTAPYHRILEFR